MKVIMHCVSCQQLKPRHFRSQLTCGTQQVQLDTDCAIVPGTYYSLIVKGLWAGPNTNQGECIGDVAGFAVGGVTLTGVDVQEEAKLKGR